MHIHIVDSPHYSQPDNVILQVVLQSPKLPGMDEVLDGLGLGVKGPPIPPMASFAVIPYPVKRKAPISEAANHYLFIASGPDDP